MFNAGIIVQLTFNPCASYTPPSSPTGNTFRVGFVPSIEAAENVYVATGGEFDLCEVIIYGN